MSLASRHSGATQSSNHSAVTSNNTNNAANNQPPTSSNRVAAAGHGRSNRVGGGGGAFANLLAGRLSMPRQLIVQARNALDNSPASVHLSFTGTIGQGTFGQIEKATLTSPPPNNKSVGNESTNKPNTADSISRIPSETTVLSVAVKRVLQDPRYKNRELSIMQKLNRHPNVVKFYYYYFSTSNSSNTRSHRNPQAACEGVCPDMPQDTDMDVYLHLVLECFPGSLCEVVYMYFQRSLTIAPLTVKLFTYQMLKALAYLHSHRICHRDIKSSNLLVNESTMVLKLCDFGSAKEMIPGSVNVSYISSRYYRAPELLFGAQMYTCAIDTWGAGCVLAEMLRHQCLFTGADSVDQLVKVIRVLGTPSTDDIASMNPMYESYIFPDVQPCPVKLFFPRHTSIDLLALMSKMLIYNPKNRLPPKVGLSDPCFDEVRDLRCTGKLPNGNPIPPHLFDLDPQECTSPSPLEHSQLSTTSGIGDKKQSSKVRSAMHDLKSKSSNPSTRSGKSGPTISKSGLNETKSCASHDLTNQTGAVTNHGGDLMEDSVRESDQTRPQKTDDLQMHQAATPTNLLDRSTSSQRNSNQS